VTFYVQKSLAHGGIRFGVSPRQGLEEIDSVGSLSTGPAGEFLRRRTSGFFFADTRPIGAPKLAETPSAASMPFWSSLRPADRKGWALLGLMALGIVFLLLGFAVIINKGPQGWLEVILGMAMIATPLVLTARKRRQLRLQEEKERAEREERERRHREMLSAYVNALEALRRDTTKETLAAATRERERLELPYDLWSEIARRTVLEIGFKELARRHDVGEPVQRAAEAVGLSSADQARVRRELYEVVLWHFLADDRLGSVQTRLLAAIAASLGINDLDPNAEQFNALRGITKESVPRIECALPLGFREHCIHVARGPDCTLYVTNKRVVVETPKKQDDVELTQIDDVEVNVDENRLTITPARPGKPIVLRVEQPVYTAALIDLATTIDERPRSFA
jgi:hypothetical protein